MIWTPLAGCFLTATGIWAGIARIRRKRDGKIGSPYKGLWWWHHVFGLFFGLLTLTWVASGLFSMNPWGFLDNMAGLAERERLAGPMHWRDVRQALSTIHDLPSGAVRVETAPLGGRAFLLISQYADSPVRLDATGNSSALTEPELRAALTGPMAATSLDLMGRKTLTITATASQHRCRSGARYWRILKRHGSISTRPAGRSSVPSTATAAAFDGCRMACTASIFRCSACAHGGISWCFRCWQPSRWSVLLEPGWRVTRCAAMCAAIKRTAKRSTRPSEG